jgi:hypothetical protein
MGTTLKKISLCPIDLDGNNSNTHSNSDNGCTEGAGFYLNFHLTMLSGQSPSNSSNMLKQA